MTVTDLTPTPARSPADLAAELNRMPHVDAWTSEHHPVDDCELDTGHGPAVVSLTVSGDTTRSFEFCGPCALEFVAPLPMSDLVDAEVCDPAAASFFVHPSGDRVVVNDRRLTSHQARFLASALLTAAGRVEAGAR